MANLQGKKISNTYEGLIKTESNSAVSGSTVLTDGAGNSLQITVNTNGTLTAQTITASNLNVSNWDEAYSWGDHSLSGYATSADVANAVNDVINAAPTALDTLDELAAALGDDANFATTITNLITGVSDRVTVLENAGFITVDTNTQLSDSDIAAMGYIKVDTNTQLTDSEIAAMGYIKTDTQLTDAEISALGYIKTDTNTQRTDAEIDARIALNPEGFITSYVDTNTQLSDADIAAMGYIKTDTNTQLSDADIAALGYIKTDTNTQRTDAEINTLIDANTNNFISDYTVTESDVTAHEGAIRITESQISDLSHFSGSYDDLTDKPAGIIARSDEEIEDVIGAAISGSGATSVVYNDAAGTIVVSSTDTNTQLTDAEIAAFGYIKTDTNTQLSDADITALGYIKVDTNTQLTDSEIAAFGYIKTDTNTQLSDSDIAAFGYIKTDTNTQRSDAEIQAIIDANSAGFITTYVDTNTQLSDADIAALGYIKTDTNTQRTDSEINALITTGISGLATETYVDNAVSGLVDSAPNTLNTLNELADALGDDPNFATTVSTNIGNVSSRVTTLENANYITDYTVTEGDVTAHESALTITESQISDLSHFSGSYNDLTDKPSAVTARTDEEIEDVVGSLVSGTGATTVTYNDASGTLTVNSTDTNTQRTDAEIISVAETEGFTKDALPLSGGTLTGDLEIFSTNGKLKIETTSGTGAPRIMLNQDGVQRSRIEHLDTNDQLTLSSYYGDIRFDNGTAGSATNKMIIKGDGNVGIGTTDPDTKLHVAGASYITGDIKIGSSLGATNQTGILKEQGSNGLGIFTWADVAPVHIGGGHVIIKAESGANRDLYVTGNVGIGETDPDAKLHISGGDLLVDGDYSSLYVGGKTNSFQDGLRMSIDDSGSGYIDHRGAENLNFRVDNSQGATTRMVIEADGNVGIGTTDPDAKLAISRTDSTYAASLADTEARAGLSVKSSSTFDSKLTISSGGGSTQYIQAVNNAATTGRGISINPYGGKVGIGETSPDAKLHVKSSDCGISSFNSDTNLIVESGGHNYVNICSGDTSRGELWFSDSVEGRGRVRYNHVNDELELWASGGKKADLDGAGNLTITGNLTENSDARLKENVSTIENALDKVNSLRGVEYNMIADDSKTKKIGFIAQEIEEVIPELVSDDGDVKSVAYSNTVALLVESIKELTDKVNDLQGQIDAMRA